MESTDNIWLDMQLFGCVMLVMKTLSVSIKSFKGGRELGNRTPCVIYSINYVKAPITDTEWAMSDAFVNRCQRRNIAVI